MIRLAIKYDDGTTEYRDAQGRKTSLVRSGGFAKDTPHSPDTIYVLASKGKQPGDRGYFWRTVSHADWK